jgi:hypothetical protein
MRKNEEGVGLWRATLVALAVGLAGCGAAIVADVNAQMNEMQHFNEAIKYERWDDAVAMAESTCSAADGTGNALQRAMKRRECLRRRDVAHNGLAESHAKAGQWDDALREERLAQKATVDMPGADAVYLAALTAEVNVPDVAKSAQADAFARETARLRTQADMRVEDYQAHALPDPMAELTGKPSMRPPAPASPPAGIAVTSVGSPAAPAFVAASPQSASFAFVVGVERYRDVPAAAGAHGDAIRFGRMLREGLGLKDSHVRMTLDDHATRSDILGGLSWLATSVPPGGRIYFYFSGHGAPAPDQSTYLLPYDGDPKDVADSAVATSEVMARLGATKAREVLAVLDSCFSGAGGRSVLPPGARPLMRIHDSEPPSHLAMFTASAGDEISGLAPGGSAGLFTELVTQGLGTAAADADGDGQITLQELSDWVSPRVAREAKRDHREQHPKLVVGSGLGAASSFVVSYGLPTK